MKETFYKFRGINWSFPTEGKIFYYPPIGYETRLSDVGGIVWVKTEDWFWGINEDGGGYFITRSCFQTLK